MPASSASGDQLQNAGSDADSNAGTGDVGDPNAACSQEEKAELSVIVKKSDGTPLEGVAVSITELGQSGTTGADGVADFGEVPPASYTAVGQKDNFAPPGGGNTTAAATQTQAAPASTSTQIALVLDALVATIAVHVQTSTGTPVEGATVSVDGKGWSGVTDAGGNFSFGQVPPDTYTVQGEKPKYGPNPASQTQIVAAGTSQQFQLVLDPITVDLVIQKPLLTLKHDNQTTIQLTLTPSSSTGDAYRIEVRRASGTDWGTLATIGMLDPFTAPIAGTFKVRGVVTIQGTEMTTSEKDLTVQFPEYSQIMGDPAVQSAMSTAWTETLGDCTSSPNQRREHGFWINLNTTTNAYEFGPTLYGPFDGPAETAGVSMPIVADVPPTPAATDQGAIYEVASFHAHTSTEFRPASLSPGSRLVGPSSQDHRGDHLQDRPGIVYDFVESPAGSGSIPFGYPGSSPAQPYPPQGKDRRTTPP